MKKDFDSWNEKKKYIHGEKSGRFYREREIWFCYLGANVGFEQDGSGVEYKRPVLVLKALSRTTCLVVPLTTSSNKHHMRVSIGKISNKNAQAIISQIRVIDTKRFVSRIAILDHKTFDFIKKAVKDML